MIRIVSRNGAIVSPAFLCDHCELEVIGDGGAVLYAYRSDWSPAEPVEVGPLLRVAHHGDCLSVVGDRLICAATSSEKWSLGIMGLGKFAGMLAAIGGISGVMAGDEGRSAQESMRRSSRRQSASEQGEGR